MAVLLPGKLLYLAHPFVASWATTRALRWAGGEFVEVVKDPKVLGQGHHATFEEVIRHCDYRGEPVVCTVRSHYDAALTWWAKNGKGLPVAEFLRRALSGSAHQMGGPHITRGRWYRHVEASDIVMRFETIGEEWNRLCARFELQGPLPEVNVTKGRDLATHTPETVQLINEAFGDEIARLGYRLSNPADFA